MYYMPSKPYQPIALLLLAFALCLPVPAISGDIEALEVGQKAFNKGNYTLSFALWSNLATQGHADAQVFVGLSYENGWGTTKSTKLAEIWYYKAAKNNNTTGQYLLGLRYIQGSDAKRAKGLMWLQRAAASGDNSAQHFLSKGKTRGWFTGITPAVTPEMLTTPPSSPSAPLKKSAGTQKVALIQ